MATTASVEQLADLSEIAAAVAGCFCHARCTGLDIKAIAPTAKAALQLGAEQSQLHADEPRYATDADYIEHLQDLRAQLQQHIDQAAKAYRQASQQADMAQQAMRAALMKRPPDYGGYAAAQRMHDEACAAMEVADETARTCWEAGRWLMVAEADFRTTYEQAETTVAAGHQLPHDGRWIAGEDITRSPVLAGPEQRR